MKSYEEILTKIPLFEGISREDLETMLKCLKVQRKSYRKGEMIFREGDSADMVGVVLNGCVQIVRDDYYGNRSILATITPPQMFGEAFSCSSVRFFPVGVYAREDTTVMLLDIINGDTPSATHGITTLG